jgi:hypothetical protein
VFRHLLGFRDVIWAIEEHRGKGVPAYVPPPDGVAFFRGVEELMIPAGP